MYGFVTAKSTSQTLSLTVIDDQSLPSEQISYVTLWSEILYSPYKSIAFLVITVLEPSTLLLAHSQNFLIRTFDEIGAKVG